MKSSAMLIPVLMLALTACSRPMVKETKETIIERPVATTPAGAPALRSCVYGSTSYSTGSVSCQAGYQFRCQDGSWQGSGMSC